MVIKNLELQINSWPIKWWLIRVNQDGQRPKGTHPSLCSSVYLSLQNPRPLFRQITLEPKAPSGNPEVTAP